VDLYGDPLPPGAVLRLGTTRLRHGFVHSVAFSPKGDFIVSGGSTDSAIRVWDVASGREIVSFPTHDDPRDILGETVFGVAVAPDGDTIAGASGLENCAVYLCSVSGKKRLAELRLPQPQMLGVKHVAFSPDGKLLACVGKGAASVIWDVSTHKPVRVLLTGQCQGVAFTPDSKAIVVAAGAQVASHDVATGKATPVARFPVDIEGMDLSADGQLVACLVPGAKAGGRTLYLTRLADGKRLHELECPRLWQRVRFFPDSKTVTAHGHIWDCATGKLLRRVDDFDNVSAISADGKTLACQLELWDIATGKQKPTFRAPEYGVEAVGALPDGQFISIEKHAARFYFWEATTGKAMQRIQPQDQPIQVAFSGDGARLATLHGTEWLQIYDRKSGKETARLAKEPDQLPVERMVFSPDARLLALPTRSQLGKGGTVLLVDAVQGKKARNLTGHKDSVYAVAFHPNSKSLIGAGYDNVMIVWDVETGRELRRMDGHKRGINSLAISPDGKWLASGSGDKTTRLWDLATGKEVAQLATGEPACLAFSPDSRRLVWAKESNDPTIHFYDIASGKEVHALRGHRGQVTCLAFSADGKRLLSGGEDTTVLVWDMTNVK